jgi:ketosteroid isomerase-like protein
LVAEWTDAVRDRDPERISDLYTDDAVWFDEAGDDEFRGRAGVQFAWDIFGYVDDVVAVDVLAVSADRAVIRWDFAMSSAMETVGISVLEFNDGQISAETVYYDSAQAP